MGQIWRPDPFNCHMFYICELLPGAKYRVHHVTCGSLFWDQSKRICMGMKTGNCVVGDVITRTTTPAAAAAKASCPLSPYPGDARKFWIDGDPTSVQRCVAGMEFTNAGELCDCIFVNSPGHQRCSGDLLLHLPFDHNFNDVTCNKAIATRYGRGVSIVNDLSRGHVAFFDGSGYLDVSFMRSWFASSKIDEFTITLWFKLTGNTVKRGAIVNNGDCFSSSNVELTVHDDAIFAGIKTDDSGEVVTSAQKFYLNGQLVKTATARGFMSDTDVPMHIGAVCGVDYFVGYIDDVRTPI
ncbi:hypothetical protein NP493_306g01018 [Ridgeia piscesae]|uniref:Uncharacterized protein n=1 Tax=Ridgeia piscesae TaxID=27915 RepID=A0AAD9NUS2_RIDPI|nr:hypothetical protein NP493_306g01018 [Ridgeia piscesae]